MDDVNIQNLLYKGADGKKSNIEFFTEIINAIPDPVFVKDKQHRWLLLNDAFCKFIGFPREELIGKSDHDIFAKEEAEIFWENDKKVFKSGIENINEESITDVDGVEHVISTKKAVFIEPETGESFLVGVIRDVTELRQTEKRLNKAIEELELISNTDLLTQIHNRRYMMSIAEHQMKISKRNSHAVLLIFFDVDDMKIINDQYGHFEGDNALVEVAELLKMSFRESDVVARIGGDEFVVLAFGENVENTQQAVQRFNDKLTLRNISSDTKYSLSVSIGSTYYNHDEDITFATLLDRADKEMYKEKSKNKV